MRRLRPALALAILAAACEGGTPLPAEDSGTPIDAAPLDGSTPDGDAPDAGSPADDEALFDVWEELRARFRESPDHRVARASALVAAGDPNAIFAFVRDEIGVVPRAGTGPLGQTRGAGPRATLRSGVGTVLDKVELLVELLRRAGHEADVRFALVPSDRRSSLALYLRDTRAPFAPPITDADLERWRARLGRDALPEGILERVDPAGDQARGWAESIASLVSAAAPLETDPSFDGYLPLARVVIDGEEVFAEPLFADATLGARITSGAPVVRSIEDAPRVQVRLWAERNHGDAEAVTLVEQSYESDALIGRRVIARTAPLLRLRELLLARPDDVGAFLPVLEVSGPDVDAETATLLGATGAPITRSGEVVEVEEDGALRIEGVSLSVDEDESARLAQVASLALAVDARSFGEVRLRIDALDASGAAIEGLSGRAFEVHEDGVRMGHALRRNRDVRRVVLLFDDSSSIPAAFDDEARVAVGLELAREVLSRPGGEVQIATVGAAEAPPFTRDLTLLETQLRSISGGSSTLWRSLADAARRRPDAIVLVSDARTTDAETDAHRAAIQRSGAPVLVLRTTSGVETTAERIAALSGGALVPVDDGTAALAALASFLPARAPAYELGYRAPDEGAAERVVRVTLTGTSIATEARYTPPPIAARVTPPAITGLFVTVTVGDVATTRALSGARPGDDEATRLERASEALLGRATLLFEMGAPSASILLDEWLTARLALRPLWRARGDYAAFVEAAERGLVVPSADQLAFAGFAAETPASLRTYVVRPRVTMITEQPRFGVGRVRRIDMMPQTVWASASREGASVAWRATLESSLHMAALEAARGVTSTASLLDGETLVAVPARSVAARFAGTPLEARWAAATEALGRGTTAVLPADGEPVALWAVDDETGSALGLLEDSSGGTYEVIRAAVERNLGFFDMIEQLASSGVVTGGVWLDLELAKARIVSYATLWIGYLGEGGISPPPDAETPEEIVSDFVEGQVEDAVLGALPDGLGDAISDAEDWYGLVSSAAGDEAP